MGRRRKRRSGGRGIDPRELDFADAGEVRLPVQEAFGRRPVLEGDDLGAGRVGFVEGGDGFVFAEGLQCTESGISDF